MADAGRPRVLNDVKCREICALVSAGYHLTGAAQYVGCSARTIRREMKRNHDFAERIRKSTLVAELDPLNAIRQSARTNWRAAAWYLERVHPLRYARRNPALVKPAEIQEFLDGFAEIIIREVRSPRAQQRIFKRLSAMSTEVEEVDVRHTLEGGPAHPMPLRSRSASKNASQE